MLNNLAQILLETASKRATQKTEEASSDFTGKFRQNTSEILTKEKHRT